MSVPSSFDTSSGRLPLPTLSLALCGLWRPVFSGEEPAECTARVALAGRCFGDLFGAGGGCGLVWRSRDRAFRSVSSVSTFMMAEFQLNSYRHELPDKNANDGRKHCGVDCSMRAMVRLCWAKGCAAPAGCQLKAWWKKINQNKTSLKN